MAENPPSKFQQFNNWHFIYLILILVLLIVALLTHRGYECKNLVTVISFGATLSSIILSILAIFMTFISNESNHRLMDGMHGLSEVPGNVKKAIEETIGELKEETKRMRNATQENIKTQLQSNDHLQQSIEKYFSQLGNNQEHNGERKEEIQNALKEYIEENTVEGGTTLQLSTEQIDIFFKKLPKNLKRICYIFVLINQGNNKSFNIDSYVRYYKCDLIPGMSMFITSFTLCLRNFDLIKLENDVNGNEHIVNIVSVADIFKEYIQNYVNTSFINDEILDIKNFVEIINMKCENDDGISGSAPN